MARNNPEYQLHKAVSTYLKLQYPNIIFRFDIEGVKLSKAQAGMNKAIQYDRGYPDLFIAEPRNGYCGLYIELKKDKTRLLKLDGTWVNEHLKEQNKMMYKLKSKGYACDFGIGFEQTKLIIDKYLTT